MKLSFLEFSLMLLFTIGADIAEAVGTLSIGIPILGTTIYILAWFFGLLCSIIIWAWLFLKGARYDWYLAGCCIELIPGLNALPWRTASLIILYLNIQRAVTPGV